jgi:hypothetical protein
MKLHRTVVEEKLLQAWVCLSGGKRERELPRDIYIYREKERERKR